MKEPIKKYIVPLLNNEPDSSVINKISVVNSTSLNVIYKKVL